MISPNSSPVQVMNAIEEIAREDAGGPERMLVEFKAIADVVGDETALLCLLMNYAVAAARLRHGTAR